MTAQNVFMKVLLMQSMGNQSRHKEFMTFIVCLNMPYSRVIWFVISLKFGCMQFGDPNLKKQN